MRKNTIKTKPYWPAGWLQCPWLSPAEGWRKSRYTAAMSSCQQVPATTTATLIKPWWKKVQLATQHKMANRQVSDQVSSLAGLQPGHPAKEELEAMTRATFSFSAQLTTQSNFLPEASVRTFPKSTTPLLASSLHFEQPPPPPTHTHTHKSWSNNRVSVPDRRKSKMVIYTASVNGVADLTATCWNTMPPAEFYHTQPK